MGRRLELLAFSPVRHVLFSAMCKLPDETTLAFFRCASNGIRRLAILLFRGVRATGWDGSLDFSPVRLVPLHTVCGVLATGWDETCLFSGAPCSFSAVCQLPRMRRITCLFSGAPSSFSYGMRCASYRMRRKLPFLLCAMLLFRRCVSYQMRRNLPFVRFAKFIFMWYASYRMRRHLPFLRCARLDSGRPAWRSRTGLSLSAELKNKNNILKKLKRKGNWMKFILHRYIFNSCRPSGHGKML